MAIKTEKIVLYHIPKCGGIAAKNALRKSGVRYDRCQTTRNYQPFGLIREHSTPYNTADVDGLFSICFVRNPFDWYRSFWAFRKLTNCLDIKFPLDQAWDNDFNRFVHLAIHMFGDFVSQLYRQYVYAVDYVGRQENLLLDFAEGLAFAKQPFDEEKLLLAPKCNQSASLPQYKELTNLASSTRLKISQAEKWVLDEFYPEIER